ncbi:MAG: hypothetical protein QM662_13480 [Gordonia sp. (in: high G+C Gram-positive bacteria)]
MTLRRWFTSGLLASTMTVSTLIGTAGAGHAAPAGPVDPGIPFSSVVYGTGCTYTLTVPVNSSGIVAFYERKRGYPPRLIGRDRAYQGYASVWWSPRRIGNRRLYAIQNGKRSPITVARVHQGYGSGGLCFAL